MTAVAVTSTSTTLRCHSCSHGVGRADASMQFVAMFMSSKFGRVPSANTSEIRRRCPACGWVNVFHPLTSRPRATIVEFK